MKMLMSAIMLIVPTMIFAQDVYRQNDSTFVYPCISANGKGLNFIGLPLETEWAKASDFDPAGTNLNSVSYLVPNYSLLVESAGYHPALGWVNDFPVETGGAYMINAKNNFDFTVIGDSVDVVYNFVVGFNPMVLPLTKPDLDMASDLRSDGADGIHVARYLNIDQLWDSMVWSISLPFNDFRIEVGMPLLNYTRMNIVWPDVTKQYIGDSEYEDLPKVSEYVQCKPYFFRVVDQEGEDFLSLENMRIMAWIKGRESEIIQTETGVVNGCGFTIQGDYSIGYINPDNFPTPAIFGDTLVVRFENRTDPVSANWKFGVKEYVISNGSQPEFFGFEEIILGSGEPFMADTVLLSPVTNVTTRVNNTVLSVEWELNEDAIEYNLYRCQTPYGIYEHVATTELGIWQFTIVGTMNFYKVVAVYDENAKVPKAILFDE